MFLGLFWRQRSLAAFLGCRPTNLSFGAPKSPNVGDGFSVDPAIFFVAISVQFKQFGMKIEFHSFFLKFNTGCVDLAHTNSFGPFWIFLFSFHHPDTHQFHDLNVNLSLLSYVYHSDVVSSVALSNTDLSINMAVLHPLRRVLLGIVLCSFSVIVIGQTCPPNVPVVQCLLNPCTTTPPPGCAGYARYDPT